MTTPTPEQKRLRALLEAIRIMDEYLGNTNRPPLQKLIERRPCDCQNCVSVREIDARKRRNNHDPE